MNFRKVQETFSRKNKTTLVAIEVGLTPGNTDFREEGFRAVFMTQARHTDLGRGKEPVRCLRASSLSVDLRMCGCRELRLPQ